MNRILALALVAAVSAPARVGAQATVATPAPSPALTALADSMARGDFGYVDALHVARNGMPLLSRTFPRSYTGVYPMKSPPGAYNYQDPDWHPFYQGRTLHTLQSVTKGIVSLVYGVAIARKDIASIDQPIAPFLPAHTDAFRDSLRKKITMRHLLTMTSGIRWPEGGGYGSDDDITLRMENSADWVSMVLAQPMETVPGTTYHYNDGAAELLADVFRGATGVDLQVYAAQHLFAPFAISRFHWKRSVGGLTDSEGGLYREPADLAKLGQLMLDQGLWNGTRLVGADWVAESVNHRWPGDTTGELRPDVVDGRSRRAAGFGCVLRLGIRRTVCLCLPEDAHGGGAESVDVQGQGDPADRLRAADRVGDCGDAVTAFNAPPRSAACQDAANCPCAACRVWRGVGCDHAVAMCRRQLGGSVHGRSRRFAAINAAFRCNPPSLSRFIGEFRNAALNAS